MPIVTVGPVDLYFEVRGSGPPVLFIMGATGDAGHFSTVAEQLADEFTALTYDRRGNSRSSRPPGWDTTTVEEQADDAAGLLRALELAPAIRVNAVDPDLVGERCAIGRVPGSGGLAERRHRAEDPALVGRRQRS